MNPAIRGLPVGQAQGKRIGIRRWRLVAGIFLVYIGYAFPDLFRSHTPLTVAFGLLLLTFFVGLYIGLLPYGMFGFNRAIARWVPLSMLGTTCLYLAVIDRGGLILPIYVCIAFVVCYPPRVSLPFVIVVAVAVVQLPQYVEHWDMAGFQWGLGLPILATSIGMYFIRVNAGNQIALYQARAEIERLAAEQERMRIARDLHDLLGHALTTVVVKAELAARLATIDPQRAAAEMSEVADLARQGLDDVRATVSGYREVSLVNELATAREVLRAAGIHAELPASTESVPGELRELFGWVVREGVTNAVRHSRAAHLRITLRGRGIAVEDDGVGANSPAPPTGMSGGNGLPGLRERAAALGGMVTAGRTAGGGWSLTVDVPK
ncbi:MAG: sensor histidine kinase [Actinomycetota bacterium]